MAYVCEFAIWNNKQYATSLKFFVIQTDSEQSEKKTTTSVCGIYLFFFFFCRTMNIILLNHYLYSYIILMINTDGFGWMQYRLAKLNSDPYFLLWICVRTAHTISIIIIII